MEDDQQEKDNNVLPKEEIKEVQPSREEYIIMLCNKLEMGEQPVHLETMSFLNSVEPQIKFTVKQLKSILIEEAPMTTDVFNLGIIMIAHKKCKNKSVTVRNHYIDLQFN
ncbi:hypothetical protein ACP4OV_013377 [Aristida adscensionis]